MKLIHKFFSLVIIINNNCEIINVSYWISQSSHPLGIEMSAMCLYSISLHNKQLKFHCIEMSDNTIESAIVMSAMLISWHNKQLITEC